MVKVSIVIPFYNVEDYFRECLDSVTNQTLDDLEIICINDGSTDDSLKIAEEFANHDNRIKIVSQENKGVGAARNRGLELSKGDYIYFMDSDDSIKLNALGLLYDFCKSNDLDILLFKQIVVNDKTGEMFKNPYYEMEFLKPFNKKVFNYKDLGNDALKLAVSLHGKLLKRDLIHSIRFPEGYIFEDNLFFAEAMLKAKRVSFYDEYFYYRRFRDNSIITTKTIKFADSIFIVNKVIELFKRENVYEYFKKSIIERKIRFAFLRFSQVDEEYKEEFFQKIKTDFTNFSGEFESDDVFKYEIDDDLRYKFRAALECQSYKEYILSIEKFELNSQLTQLNEKLNKIDFSHKKLEEDYSNLKNRYSKLEDKCSNLENNYSKLEDKYSKLEVKFKHSKEQNIVLNKKYGKSVKLYGEILNSRSWKLTKPLRRLKNFRK